MTKMMKAIEKAKAEREFNLHKEKPAPAQVPPSVAEAPQDDRLGLEINYSQTRIQKIDPKLFQKSKILSLFHNYTITDQIKTVRTQIIQTLKKDGGNSILVTSANPYEGKTFTAVNLGVSIALELDKTVMLVDADLRTPTKKHKSFSSDFFHTNVEKGLADYLLNGDQIPELLINPGIERLVLLPAGKPMPNSAEILGSSRMKKLVEEMKSRYADERIIIFDTSSVLTSPDPLVIANYVDGILLVVEQNRTTADQLKNVMNLLKDKKILGTVINKVQ